MVSISQTPWSGYTLWTNATTGMIAARTVWASIMGELSWSLNGGITADNLGFLTNMFYSMGRSWSMSAVKEHKIKFDPQDGHDHQGHHRSRWNETKITKKNLDPRSARVVWTALDGSTFSVGSSGLVVVGGVHSFYSTPGSFSLGITPGDALSAHYLTPLTCPNNFIRWCSARYGNTTLGAANHWPWADYVQPVVVANFLIPVVYAGGTTTPLPPAIYSYGRWGIEMVPLGNTGWTAGSSPGFWVWYSGFSMQSPQTNTTWSVAVVIPWMAFGPGREKVFSWA